MFAKNGTELDIRSKIEFEFQPFVLYINDILSHISQNTRIIMYADDTKIWRQMQCFKFDDHLGKSPI